MKKLLFLLFALIPTLASAENLLLKYKCSWEGMEAGLVTLQNIETGDGYNVTTSTDTTGIVKTLTNFYSHTVTVGKITNGQYLPTQYDTKWQTKKNSPHIIVTYAENGEVSEVAEPPENRNKRPEVEQVHKQGSFDFASVFLNSRGQIKQMIESGQALPLQFTIKVFDARRVFNANFSVVGYENKKVDGNKQKLLHITLNRSVIAGFTTKELERIKNFNPTFDLWLNEDYIPVIGSGQAVIGHAEMNLVSACKGESCK